MPLSFFDFIHLGSHQWRVQSNPFASLFMRIFGPLGIHARIRNARVINACESLDLKEYQVLDLGSGHGYVLYWMALHYPQATMEGIDIDQQQVEECENIAQSIGLSNLHFKGGTFESLPDQSLYDLVISIDVLEHVEDDTGMLRKIAEVLRPGGTAVIHVPLRHQLQQRIFPVFKKHTVNDHIRDEYLPDEIIKKVEQAGLCVIKVEYGFGFWGELSFELNNLFWNRKWLRTASALMTLPISLIMGYVDVRSHLRNGNSILLVVRQTQDQ